MPGTVFTSTLSGDWSTATIWSTDSVPDSSSADVTIDTAVTIAQGESFTAGAVDIHSGPLEVDGSLSVAGLLTIESGESLELGLSGESGFVSAGTILNDGSIAGASIIASAGTLTNDGIITDSFGATLTVAPSIYQEPTATAEFVGLRPEDATLILAPTSGAGGFANLVAGTLSGDYSADDGATLELPGTVSEIVNGSLTLVGAAARIEAGGEPIQASLTTVGANATLALASLDYVSANPLTIDGGVIALSNSLSTLSQGALAAGNADTDAVGGVQLILANGSSELEGNGTVLDSTENAGEILAAPSSFGSLLDLVGPVSGSGSLVIGDGAILELAQANTEAASFELPVLTSESAPVLRLDQPGSYTGTIFGFTTEVIQHTVLADAVDLPGFAPNTLSDSYSGTSAGGTLTITEPGAVVSSLTFSGDYTHSTFTLAADGNGGTDVELVPCFARGTRIATPACAVPVEDLRVGASVLTAAGAARPIVWIGQRRIDCRRHPRPELVRPVRVRASALAACVPARDLVLSPDHAVFCDGVLIPVQYLINGASIAQERVDAVHYFHVELESHDVILAEGLPTESYLDTGNRAAFAYGAAHTSLHPNFSPLGWNDACAPLCVDGPAIAAVRQRLLKRAAVLGYRTSAEPDVHVETGGRVIRRAAVKGKLHQFLLPAGTHDVRIVSRTGVPAGLDLASQDRRELGARIAAIFICGRTLALEDAALAEGFYPIERNGAEQWRWTDGSARLLLPDAPFRSSPILLELLLRDTMPSWQSPRPARELAAVA